MIRKHSMILFAIAASCGATATFAQVAVPMAPATPANATPANATPANPAPACTAPGTLPAEVAGWAAPHRPITAARKIAGLAAATLEPGQPVDAALPHTPEVAYPVQPAKPGGSVSYGGLFAFTVPAAGTYRIALDSHSWTDVIEDGAAVPSIAHGHGPACTSLAKMVDYTLQPGRHLLQISAQGEPHIAVMVARLP